jgi:hypothetical protein
MSANILFTKCFINEKPFDIKRSLENFGWICKVNKFYSAPILEENDEPPKMQIVFFEVEYTNTQGATDFKDRLMKHWQEPVYKLDQNGCQIISKFDEYSNPLIYEKWRVHPSCVEDIERWATFTKQPWIIWPQTEPTLKLIEPISPPTLKHNSPISIDLGRPKILSLNMPHTEQHDEIVNTDCDDLIKEKCNIIQPKQSNDFIKINRNNLLSKKDLENLSNGKLS